MRNRFRFVAVILVADDFIVVLAATGLGTLDEFRDDFACLADYYMATLEETEVFNGVPVVQRTSGNGGHGKMNRLDDGNRGNGAGHAYGFLDVKEFGFLFLGRELVSTIEVRGLGSVSQFRLTVLVVHLDDHAVNRIGLFKATFTHAFGNCGELYNMLNDMVFRYFKAKANEGVNICRLGGIRATLYNEIADKG